MDIIDRLMEGSCGEPSAVVRLIHGLDAVPESPVFVNMKSTLEVESLDACTKIVAETKTRAVSAVAENTLHEHAVSLEEKNAAVIIPDTEARKENEAELQDVFLSFGDGGAGFLHSSLLHSLGVQQEFMNAMEYFRNADMYRPQYNAGEEEEEHGHTDDCTPSCGPNYLMEIQNPTWETVIYNSYTSTMQSLRGKTIETDTSLRDFLAVFDAAVLDNSAKYEYSTARTAEKRAFDEAVMLARAGRFLEAIPHLESALHLDEANTEAWTLLALSNYMCQNDSRCISACRCHLQAKASDSTSRNLVLLLMATCLANESDFSAAQAVLFEFCTANYGISEDIQRDLVKCTSNVEALIRALTLQAGTSPADGPLHWALGILHFGLENFEVAGRHFETVLQQNTASPCVVNQIGACLQNLGRHGEALELQNRALELCPGFLRALYNKAITESSMENFAKALRTVASAVENLDQHIPEYSDQFWHLAARIAPRLANKTTEEHATRLKIMSAVLGRNLQDFQHLLRSQQ